MLIKSNGMMQTLRLNSLLGISFSSAQEQIKTDQNTKD